MVARVQSPGLGDGRKVGQRTFTPSPPQTLAQLAGIHIRPDYSYMNDDVFSLASILNLKETLGRLRVTFTANGKRQIQVENFSEYKITKADKNCPEQFLWIKLA